jgi:DNA-binding response OmpR family regulator
MLHLHNNREWGFGMGSETHLKGCSILVVEDDPLISFELTSLFESVGAQIRAVGTWKEAVLEIGQYQICAALLDHGLHEDNVAQLCEYLTECQIPYMFYTGCPDLEQMYPCAVVVQKPASGEVLLASMAKLLVTDPHDRAGCVALLHRSRQVEKCC